MIERRGFIARIAALAGAALVTIRPDRAEAEQPSGIATKNWFVIERHDGSLDVMAKIDNAFDIRVGESGAHRPRRATVHGVEKIEEIPHQNHNPKFLPDDLFRAFDIHLCEGCGRGIHFHLYPAVAVQRAGCVVALRFICPQGGGSIEVDVDQLKPSMLMPNGEFVVEHSPAAMREHVAKWWNEPSPFLPAFRGDREAR